MHRKYSSDNYEFGKKHQKKTCQILLLYCIYFFGFSSAYLFNKSVGLDLGKYESVYSCMQESCIMVENLFVMEIKYISTPFVFLKVTCQPGKTVKKATHHFQKSFQNLGQKKSFVTRNSTMNDIWYVLNKSQIYFGTTN